MSTKNLKTRIQHKIDIYDNWELATNFIPLKGEIIIYTPDPQVETDTRPVRMKIGDGTTPVAALEFISTKVENELIADSENAISGIAVSNALNTLNSDVLGNLKFRVSNSIPVDEKENTITFVV